MAIWLGLCFWCAILGGTRTQHRPVQLLETAVSEDRSTSWLIHQGSVSEEIIKDQRGIEMSSNTL
jgi:hypothetical protein